VRRALLVLALLALPLSAAAQDPGEVAREVHARGGYGDALDFRSPSGDLGSFPPRPGAGEDQRRWDRGPGRGDLRDRETGIGGRGAERTQMPRFRNPFGGGAGVLGKVVLYGAFVFLALLIVWLAFQMRGQGGKPKDPEPEPEEDESPEDPFALPWDVGDPDALAAEGRFDEAILALLVQALKSVGWVPDGQRSFTAREILASVASSDPRRAPLGEVVTGAERVRFAGAPATREAFEEIKRWRQQIGAPA